MCPIEIRTSNGQSPLSFEGKLLVTLPSGERAWLESVPTGFFQYPENKFGDCIAGKYFGGNEEGKSNQDALQLANGSWAIARTGETAKKEAQKIR